MYGVWLQWRRFQSLEEWKGVTLGTNLLNNRTPDETHQHLWASRVASTSCLLGVNEGSSFFDASRETSCPIAVATCASTVPPCPCLSCAKAKAPLHISWNMSRIWCEKHDRHAACAPDGQNLSPSFRHCQKGKTGARKLHQREVSAQLMGKHMWALHKMLSKQKNLCKATNATDFPHLIRTWPCSCTRRKVAKGCSRNETWTPNLCA